MSPLVRGLFIQLGAIGGSLAVCGIGYLSWQLLQMDPLARYKGQGDDSTLPAIEMTNVSVRFYTKGELKARFNVDNLDVSKDRGSYQMIGIRDGEVITEDSKFAVTAPSATYRYYERRLLAEEGAHVKNEDLDINCPSFVYSERTRILEAPGIVTGMLKGGKLRSIGFNADLNKSLYATTGVSWIGKAENPIFGGQPRMWEFTQARDGTFTSQGDIITVTKARASDGELIVKADQIVWDKKTDILTATGNVRYFGEEANLTCAKAVVYRKEGRSVLTGEVVNMLIKSNAQEGLKEEPIPPLMPVVPEEIKASRPGAPISDPEKEADNQVRSAESFRDFPVTVIAKEIEYWYREGNRRANIKGSPQARQELVGGRWRRAWSHTAKWDGQADQLTLESRTEQKDARFKSSLGDDFKAFWFKMSTKEGDDSWTGSGVEGVTYIDDDEDRRGTTGGGTGNIPPTLRGPIGA